MFYTYLLRATYHANGASIIFSYWTSTLDLLSQLLRKAHITYRQVDGRTSYAERSKSLEAFRKDPKILVLLMSIEIGAVGYIHPKRYISVSADPDLATG